MSWIILAVLSMASLGISMLAARATSAFPVNISTLFDMRYLPVLVAYAGFSILGAVFFLLALREPGAKTAVVASILALDIAFVAVAAYFIFGETPSNLQIAGIVLAMISVFLLSQGS